ncbi:hypothetical protein C0995_014263 [Termitomyces sp. Mi166|nr:hypothetical protein C0995_014263 [Termitomyces sp. Mi166\
MPSVSPCAILPSDLSNPSIPKRVIHHKWDGTRYSQTNGNFTQWTEKLKDAMILNGICAYIFDPILPCPEKETEPHTYANWNPNNCLTITFIKTAIDNVKHHDLIAEKGAQHWFEDLKACAEQEGPIKQIALL